MVKGSRKKVLYTIVAVLALFSIAGCNRPFNKTDTFGETIDNPIPFGEYAKVGGGHDLQMKIIEVISGEKMTELGLDSRRTVLKLNVVCDKVDGSKASFGKLAAITKDGLQTEFCLLASQEKKVLEMKKLSDLTFATTGSTDCFEVLDANANDCQVAFYDGGVQLYFALR
jgi:hypothetical protein